jgi:hypothetical protein
MVVNCEHVWKEISNYLDDEVDAATRAAMEAHFKDCKRCTAVLDGTRNVIQLYGDDRLLELPAGFSRRLQNKLSQHSSSSTFGGLRSIWMFAVAAVALLVGGLTLGNSAVYRRADTRSLLARPARNIPPSLMVALSTEGRVFHVPGCKYLHKRDGESTELMTAAQAMKDGYAPCPRCLRQYLTARMECPRAPFGPALSLANRERPEPGPGL